jgi:anti-sigma B factor antagonist
VITSQTPEPLHIRYRLSSGVAVVDVRGEIDVSTCELLRDRLLLALTDQDRRSMVVNLADVDFIDSTGLGVLVAVWHRAQASPGIILALTAPSPRARTVFATTGLTKVFPLYDTEAQAVQACLAPPGGQPR